MSLGIDELAYVKESDIYDNFDFRGEIYMGYIALPDDIRQIPPGLKLRDGKTVDSFASAMVRAASPASLRRIGGGEVPYHASFLSRETFPVISANEVLSAGQPKELMRNKLVIIGANWHTLGYERGPEVSAFQTPVGDIPAAFIHANYVEAILDGRVYKIWQGSALILLQVLLGLGVAIIFRLDLRFSIKLAVALLPYTALVMLNYLYLVSLDVFLPVILIIAYSVLEQIRRRPNERQAQQTAM